MNRLVLHSLLLLGVLQAPAATVTYVGFDLSTSGAWRTEPQTARMFLSPTLPGSA